MYERYIKRIIDITISLIAAVIFLVPSLIIALAIRLDSRGPVIFSHIRAGRNNQPFRIYKFRSMVSDTPQLATREFKNANTYITRVGRILRKLSLDEIPQLWNVLRGDMSIVGPRPVLLKEKALIQRRADNGSSQLRPGITGWAQVRGRDLIGPVKKARLDAEYRDRMSFMFDSYCLLLTVLTVISFRGHAEGYSDKHNGVINDELSSVV